MTSNSAHCFGYNAGMNKKKSIFLCAINNVLSGSCNEDCKFCTQSVRYKADIERYNYKTIEQIVSEAGEAVKNGALGYCLVTAGKGLDDKKTEYIAKTALRLKKEFPKLKLIACNGTADKEQLAYLKKSGIDSYNHNLETSEEYYPKICTSHSWKERYATCEAVKSAGLSLCCGGIFGMGEELHDRDELLKAISSLSPESVPLNFYIPNPALPIPSRTIDRNGALDIISKARELLKKESMLMVAGGREAIFNTLESEDAMFRAGADAIVIGNYLTTKGETPDSDRRRIKALGYEIATECHDS